MKRALLCTVMIVLLLSLLTAAEAVNMEIVSTDEKYAVYLSGSGNVLLSGATTEEGMELSDASGEIIPMHFISDEVENEISALYDECARNLRYDPRIVCPIPWNERTDRSPEALFCDAELIAASGNLAVVSANNACYRLLIDLSDGAIRTLPSDVEQCCGAFGSEGFFAPLGKQSIFFHIDPAEDKIISYDGIIPDDYVITAVSDEYIIARESKVDPSGSRWTIYRRSNSGTWDSADMGKLVFHEIPNIIRMDAATGSAFFFNQNTITMNDYVILWERGKDEPYILSWTDAPALVRIPIQDSLDENGMLVPDTAAFHSDTYMLIRDWLPSGNILAGEINESGDLLDFPINGEPASVLAHYDAFAQQARRGPAMLYGNMYTAGDHILFSGCSPAVQFYLSITND